jgi:hypothetical protein
MQTIHEERVDLRTCVGVLGTMLGAFMATLGIQVTNASLRDITGGIAATQDEVPGFPPAISSVRSLRFHSPSGLPESSACPGICW